MTQPRACEIASGVRIGERSAVEGVRDALGLIAAGDGELHAFLEVFEEGALARAVEIDEARVRGLLRIARVVESTAG